MVVRIWKGRALDGADAYFAHVTSVVFPKLRRIDGFRGGRVLRRNIDGSVEFLVITEWASWDAVRGFAGARPEIAVVEPEARALLTEVDEHVQHFDLAHVVQDVGGPDEGRPRASHS
jgi:heme-degrading monooxygenase HmoA